MSGEYETEDLTYWVFNKVFPGEMNLSRDLKEDKWN